MSEVPQFEIKKLTAEVQEILSRDCCCSPGLINLVQLDYERIRVGIPDAPDVENLKPEDAHGVYNIHKFDFENVVSWKEFVTRVTCIEVPSIKPENPFSPNWNSMSDDRPTQWVSDTGVDLPVQYKDAIAKVFDRCTPLNATNNWNDQIGTAPTNDTHAIISVTEGLEFLSNVFLDGMDESTGVSTALRRWSQALAMLAGLGFTMLRHFAEKFSHIERDWIHWANCSDAELREDIVEAQKNSGYPISLLRADFKDLQRIVVDAMIAPKWLKACLAVHLMKYVRYIPNFRGNPTLWAVYRGEYSHIAFTEEGINQRMLDDTNADLRKSVCSILGIRQVARRNRLAIDDMIDEVLAHLHPRDFPRQRDLRDAPYLIVPRSVKITPSHELRSDFKWMDPGIMVSNIAKIDLNTGKVEYGTVTGPQALCMAWPRQEMRVAEMKTWWANLPKVVKPMRPSQLLKLLFRNINTLGHDDGYWALIDSLIIGDLARDELAGTAVGSAMLNEYPLFMVYPMGHTKETTTNQGKTSYARTVVNALAQGVPVTGAGRSPSAPSQRAAAAPIEEFGTALYDEFQLPSSHDHFLAQAGLQILSTGGVSSPGRAGENGGGAALKHPLFFTVKVASFPPDIRNRSIATFMDVLTDETRGTPEELAVIMSGIIATLVRLSALMWIRKEGFVEKASKAKLVQGKLRFSGHMTLATLLAAEQKPDDINAYLIAAEAKCDSQQLAADASGLSENIGLMGECDGVYYFETCSAYTLEQLAEVCNEDQVMCLAALRRIVEDAGARRFGDVLSNHKVKERAFLLKFSAAIDKGLMKRDDGWQISKRKKMGDLVHNGKEVVPSKGSRESVILTKKDPE